MACEEARVMSVFGSGLSLRNAVGSVVCDYHGAGGQLSHRATSYCPCFTPGTLIKTDFGEVPVEELTVGTRVLTRDNGYRAIVWTGHRLLEQDVLSAHPSLYPIRISKGALGPNLPERDTRVSPQHRMLLNNDQIRAWFDADEVLVAAHLLTCFKGVAREAVQNVTYIHFMFDQHEIVLADGAWSESYQPSDMRLGAIDEQHRVELLSIFPELADDAGLVFPAARASIDAAQFSKAVLPSE